MGNKRFIATVVIAFLSISLTVVAWAHSIGAETPSDFIHFADSGVTIFSPLNANYSDKNLVLNLTLWSADYNGVLDPNISMNYTIDNIYNGSVPLKSIGVDHDEAIAAGVVALPQLPEGSHKLTIYLYGLNQKWIDPRYLSFMDTVYFSTANVNPPVSPIITPTLSPSIPELPSLIILLALLITATLATFAIKKKAISKI